ncbi:apoptosis-associated speck-like protein containing a CARD [Pseudophryne corroboree]|uniref:apoptosis-associated speck-like protein containing a CARD n=1 Tax=Pseudophryne corroboree TaxID=495146 RepID=UPI00308212DE
MRTLKFQSEPYQYTEINLKANDTDICLHVSEEDREAAVWEAQLTKGDIREWTGQMAEPNQKGNSLSMGPFVDKHREVLIREVPLVEPVLDGLKSEKLLTDEQYDFVRSRTTSQDKMRALYDFIRSWGDGDKSKLYNILKDTNKPLVRRLEQEDGSIC